MLQRRADGLELRLREDLDVLRAAQPGGAQLDLRSRFLARDEECAASAGRDGAEGHEQKRRLAYAGLAADEHEAGRDEPTAENTIELGHAGRDAMRLLGVDVDESRSRPGRGLGCSRCLLDE